jgi:hypothetical protein
MIHVVLLLKEFFVRQVNSNRGGMSVCLTVHMFHFENHIHS